MQFLVYIFVLLLGVGGILVELDWLTKPKLERPAQVASTVASAPVTKPRVVGPNVTLSPVYPKNPNAGHDDATSNTEQAAEQTSKPVVTTEQAAVIAPPALPTPTPVVETQGAALASATEIEPKEAEAKAPAPVAMKAPEKAPEKPAAQVQLSAPAAVTQKAPNSCDVQACSAAYQSFRASDCSYQPYEGPRRTCEGATGATQKVASQSRDAIRPLRTRDEELRDVERQVREMTDDEFGPQRGGRRVIVIERGGPRGWRAW